MAVPLESAGFSTPLGTNGKNMGANPTPLDQRKPSIQLGISAWSVWPDGLADGELWQDWLKNGEAPPAQRETDLSFVDAMTRRRLSGLSRIALHVTGQAGRDWASTPMIFASRHGELNRTVGILQELAREDVPSPAAFSLSVHNTSLGIASIARRDPAPGTALAAGEETLLWALLDASVRLADQPIQPVLLVYADEPLPAPYSSIVDCPEPAHAFALLLVAGSDVSLDWAGNPLPTESAKPMSLAFLGCLLGHHPKLEWSGRRLKVQGECHA